MLKKLNLAVLACFLFACVLSSVKADEDEMPEGPSKHTPWSEEGAPSDDPGEFSDGDFEDEADSSHIVTPAVEVYQEGPHDSDCPGFL